MSLQCCCELECRCRALYTALCLLVYYAAPTIMELSKDGKILLSHIQKEISALSASFEQKLNQKFEEFKQQIDTRDSKIEELELHVANLEMSLKTLEDAKDNDEQYSRKDSIILTGPAVGTMTADEDTRSHVISLLKAQLKVDVTANDISTSHRLGPIRRASPGNPERRNIYVKFVRRDTKKLVIQQSKKQKKNAPLVAFESLTEKRRSMLKALQGMKKAVPDRVKGCTSMDGKLYAFTPPLAGQTRDHRHHIPNVDTLRDFCSKFVQKPLQDFLGSFAE